MGEFVHVRDAFGIHHEKWLNFLGYHTEPVVFFHSLEDPPGVERVLILSGKGYIYDIYILCYSANGYLDIGI
jgi:hypothetical protein